MFSASTSPAGVGIEALTTDGHDPARRVLDGTFLSRICILLKDSIKLWRQ
jgi:hypothetical protein